MHVLFTANPMFGHVNTMLPMAKAAQRAGHEVVFATGKGMTEHIEGHGIATWSVGPATAPAGASTNWIEYFLYAATERVTTLVPRSSQWRPGVVIHDETDLAGAVVGTINEQALHVVHGLGLMPPVRIWDLFGPTIDQLIRSSGGNGKADGVRDALYLSVCPPSLQPPPDDWIWTRLVPLRHRAGLPGPSEEIDMVLGELPYGRTVHLTLGTVFSDAVETLRTAIDGLRDLPANLIVTTGPDGDPDAFGAQPAHVVVARYLPHSLLLPRCDLVVSHAGAGSMFGSLSHGLPQLALPQGADQHMNAEALARSGAGLVLDGVDVTASGVATAARRLLDEPAFSDAAAAVAAEMAAMPEADAVLNRLLHRDEFSPTP